MLIQIQTPKRNKELHVGRLCGTAAEE